MNHHLSSDKLWWTESPSKGPVSPMLSQNALFNFSQNHQETARDGDDNNANKELREVIVAEREAMFEKPLTPSDVGKLNRLVIPKQHAERYFPIGGNSSGGTEAVEKGLLLSFEDELGKLWRFRYSYWNSSQSYVLTKGWSRYVKEKQLQAGDTVIFERFRDDGERFFIGWRRRNTVVVQAAGGWTPPLYSSGHPYPSQNSRPDGPPLPYQTHCLHAEIEEKISSRGGVDTERAEASAGVQNQTSSGNSRTLRLFGVDLKCQLEEPLADGPDQQGEPQYHPQSSSNATTSQDHVSHYQNHVDINFSGDRCKPE